MKISLKKGLNFGLTSAVITTLGLITGLNSSTGSKMIIISGILIIAIADSFSDALGIHISTESEGNYTNKEVWQATVATFLSKFIFALTFLIPYLFLNLNLAFWIDIIWGGFILVFVSYRLAKQQNLKPQGIIFEHLFISVVVLFLGYYIGKMINQYIK
ncbi:MAG: hypothetical protein PHU32_05560 [Candidatus ainarchaeum sp.]|jgi:VIT1/CCC1 family predicted Fe2+/Mn2+ transporter|nr:hypothetical protein [Candidatus ainarchaeum sp.]